MNQIYFPELRPEPLERPPEAHCTMGVAMPLLRKLENYVQLTESEKRSLLQAEIEVRDVEARLDIVREHQQVEGATLLLEGFACRHKLLPDGRRQILGYILPGDMCDPRIFLLDRMDHSIAALSRARIAIWPRKALLGLTAVYPRITRAFWWSALVDEGIAREWLVSLGQRTALERLSHLICELYYRLKAIDLVRGNGFDFPVTQAELGDALGLSAVHVNRTLQDMRRKRLVRLVGRRLTVLNLEALSAIAMFNPGYLHLDARARRPRLAADREGRLG
jgi:CRP-like cAMP-binding protein